MINMVHQESIWVYEGSYMDMQSFLGLVWIERYVSLGRMLYESEKKVILGLRRKWYWAWEESDIRVEKKVILGLRRKLYWSWKESYIGVEKKEILGLRRKLYWGWEESDIGFEEKVILGLRRKFY